jgi:hypothetical protein
MEMSCQLHALAALPPQYAVRIRYVAGRASEPVGSRAKSLVPAGNITLAVQPIARRYTD